MIEIRGVFEQPLASESTRGLASICRKPQFLASLVARPLPIGRPNRRGESMATVVQEHAGPVAEVRSEPEPVQGGDPSILGVPIFVVGSIALGLSLVGYVPAAAGGIVVPVIFAATGVGLVIATIWAAALGQTMVASIFGLFAGFWLSFSILELGVLHNWLLIPAANVNKSVALFLIS